MKKLLLAITSLACAFPVYAATNQQQSYQAYKKIVQPIVNSMTLEQKIGQMTLPAAVMITNSNNYVIPSNVQNYNLGGLLVAGSTTPTHCKHNEKANTSICQIDDSGVPSIYFKATMKNWQAFSSGLNAQSIKVSISKNSNSSSPTAYLYPLLGIDAVHGNNHVIGSVLFPQNIALAATHNDQNFYNAGYWTAQSVMQAGFNWIYAPTVAVMNNPQWGRTYETMGSDPARIYQYAKSYVEGAQMSDQTIHGVLATVKHYMGDGATFRGIDEGDVQKVTDMSRFIRVNSEGYRGGIDAGVGSIMVSYSAVNQIPMSINSDLLNLLFTGKYKGKNYLPIYHGFTVSDYGAVDKVASQGLPTTHITMSYNNALTKAIAAGLDMYMISPWTSYQTVQNFQNILLGLTSNQTIPMSEINNAVTNILAVKYAMGLIRDPQGHIWGTDQDPQKDLVSDPNNNRAAQDALNAAEQSLVLLKNNDTTIPLNIGRLKYIVLLGQQKYEIQHNNKSIPLKVNLYNNIGAQAGGWTLSWQGFEGNALWSGKNKKTSHATTILDGIKNIVKDRHITIIRQTNFGDVPSDMTASNSIIIAVAAEPPYAEFMGDIGNPACYNSTDTTGGCLYNQHLNTYMPSLQKANLQVNLDQGALDIIARIHHAQRNVPVVTILLSGRPMITDTLEDESSAFIAAWLPGTTGGQAIVNALFGNYHFCNGSCGPDSPNTLPVDWPSESSNLQNYPVYSQGKGLPKFDNPRHQMGDGLAT